LQIYTNISLWGQTRRLHLIKKVENLEGVTLWTPPPTEQNQVLQKGAFVSLVKILHEAMLNGTGQAARALGLTAEAAGKTGTTTNFKDAWFAGFTANHVAVVWTGYDDNTPVQLSGASGALPIWTQYMKSMMNSLEFKPFEWPMDAVSAITATPEQLMELGVPENKAVSTELFLNKRN
jgi:penicillin-binding protein 1B